MQSFQWPPTSRLQPAFESVFNRTVDAFGGLDILVNSVGFAGGAGIVDTSDGEWDDAFNQTLFPAIRASPSGPCRTCAGGAAAPL